MPNDLSFDRTVVGLFNCVRLAVGAGFTIVGTVLLVGGWFDRPVDWAALLLGVALLVALGIDLAYGSVAGKEYDPSKADDWARVYVTAFTTAPALILAVLAAFGSGALSLVVKAGVFALVAALLLGVMLAGMLIGGMPKTSAAGQFTSLVVNLAFGALAFGLISIAVGLASRV